VPVEEVHAIRRESDRLAAVVAGGDEDAPIAACPGWTVRDLAAHVGEVQRFWAWVLREGVTEHPASDAVPVASPGPDLVSWLAGGADLLVTALQGLDPQTPSWAWWPGPWTVGQVARHQLHEVALHRWDAEETGGSEPEPFPADQAADGIDELLHVTLSAERRPWAGRPGVLVIDPDDVEPGWTLDCTGPLPVVHDGAASTADCRLLGPAADVQLLLWGRPRQFRYRGDAGLLTDLLAWPSFD
jgi:uncharacterized protein (TIGR03083 family)